MLRSKAVVIGLISVGLFGLSTTWTAAQAIPQDVLAADRAELMDGCLNRESDENVCVVLTACIERNFVNDLDYDMYRAMRDQLRSQVVTDEVRQYLDRVAVVCAAEVRAQIQN